jgi:hypothetical protein
MCECVCVRRHVCVSEYKIRREEAGGKLKKNFQQTRPENIQRCIHMLPCPLEQETVVQSNKNKINTKYNLSSTIGDQSNCGLVLSCPAPGLSLEYSFCQTNQSSDNQGCAKADRSRSGD